MSTGSEKYTIILVVPTGAFDSELGTVSSVKGCADANGTETNDMTSSIIRTLFIY